ncbi:hypothetical protein [Rubritalea tangerina]|uniref:hypothetical protein n=1 Tax=Rubritalea tangerina TaxID=430798 RepID=UPI0036227D9C
MIQLKHSTWELSKGSIYLGNFTVGVASGSNCSAMILLSCTIIPLAACSVEMESSKPQSLRTNFEMTLLSLVMIFSATSGFDQRKCWVTFSRCAGSS